MNPSDRSSNIPVEPAIGPYKGAARLTETGTYGGLDSSVVAARCWTTGASDGGSLRCPPRDGNRRGRGPPDEPHPADGGLLMRAQPEPFYDEGDITIYHGDLRELWPIDADVIVTDPPYGMAYRSKRSETVIGDHDAELRDWLLKVWDERPALVFGTWRSGRPQCRALLVWDKGKSPGMGDLSLPWGSSHEEIYVRGEGWISQSRQGSVLSFDGLSSQSRDRPDHPTPKPVALMRHLLERCPEGVVLDPFMGSGSTLVAAKELGRRAIGVEIEERYCKIAAERLAQQVLDLGGV